MEIIESVETFTKKCTWLQLSSFYTCGPKLTGMMRNENWYSEWNHNMAKLFTSNKLKQILQLCFFIFANFSKLLNIWWVTNTAFPNQNRDFVANFFDLIWWSFPSIPTTNWPPVYTECGSATIWLWSVNTPSVWLRTEYWLSATRTGSVRCC